MLIVQTNGNPFKTVAIAKSVASRKSLRAEQYGVVEIQGGFAIQLAEDVTMKDGNSSVVPEPDLIDEVSQEQTTPTDTLFEPVSDASGQDIPADAINPEKEGSRENWVKDKPKIHKPKEPDVAVTESWRPADVTEIPEDCKDPDYAYRFARKNKMVMDKKLRNQWTVDHEVAAKMKKKKLVFINNSCDSTLIVGDMILVKMKTVTEASRKKYYKALSKGSLTQRTKDFNERAGVRSIGEIEEKQVSAM